MQQSKDPAPKEEIWKIFQRDQKQIFELFLQNHGISDYESLRPWQKSYLNLPFNELTGAILELPPGAGKTITSIWVIMVYLVKFWGKRVIFAVPLRMLAKQQALDIQKDLDLLNDYLGLTERNSLKVAVAEGPGARVDLINNSVIVATYEHAGGELRRNPELVIPQARRWVSLVIVDEIHEISKDRGLAVDDVLYFSKLRVYSRTHGLDGWTFPHVVGMSGTLAPWQQSRLLEAYGSSIFPNGVYTLENLACVAGATCPKEKLQSARAKRVFLKLGSDPRDYLIVLKEILSSVTSIRDGGSAVRMVVFLDTVRSVELAYLAMATSQSILKDRGFPVAAIGLKTEAKELFSMLQSAGFSLKGKVKDSLDKLQRAGIYIHHAQLKDSPDGNGKNLIEAQLAGRGSTEGLPEDFVAVFSTSTLAVGINLAPTQVGFLGPNTLWTVDKAEQMIGRVGRSPQDSERSVVFVTESVKYLAPGISAVFAPTEWFAARMLSAMEFGKAGCVRSVENQLGEVEFYETNLDIRGFLSPSASGELSRPDIPANGLLPLAQSWNLLDENFNIKPETRAALALSRMDPRNLPLTIDIVEAPPRYLSWRVILLWALLLVGFPSGWERLFRGGQPSIKVLDTNFLLTETDSFMGERLLAAFGQTHEAYPGEAKTPSAKSSTSAKLVWSNLLWALGVDGSAWPFGTTMELVELLMKLLGFIQNIIEDKNSFYLAAHDNMVRLVDELSTTEKFLRASSVLFFASWKDKPLPPSFRLPLQEVIIQNDHEMLPLLNDIRILQNPDEVVDKIRESLKGELSQFPQ